MSTKSARRRAYLNAPPATAQEIGLAIQKLVAFFDPHGPVGKEPIPVWMGLLYCDSKSQFEVLLGEYRRMRAELLLTRNHLSRALFDMSQIQPAPKLVARRRFHPLIKLILKNSGGI